MKNERMIFDGFDAIYTRQSKDKEDSLSIITQEEFGEKMCIREIKYYSDPGYSGKDMNRPGLQKLLKDIESGQIRRIIVYRLDRLTRSLFDLVSLWETLNKYDATFISATEQLDTSTPMGKMFVFIIIMVAEWERENICIRMKDNYYKRVSLGRWPGGRAPYGYQIAKQSDSFGEYTTLEANEGMEVLEWMFHTYYFNITSSLGDIQRELNQKGVPGPTGLTWTSYAISRLLRNPVNVKADQAVYWYFKKMGIKIDGSPEDFSGEFGAVLVGKDGKNLRKKDDLPNAVLSVGNWKGYIPSEVWLGCQEKLKENERLGKNGKGGYSWLAGTLKCGYCHYAMLANEYASKARGKVRTVHCSGKYLGRCSGQPRKELDSLEDLIEQELIKVIEQSKSEEILINKPEFKEEIKLTKIDEEIENFVAIIRNGKASKLTIEVINKELEALYEERKELLETFKSGNKSTFKSVPLDFTRLDFDGKKAVVQSYINKVYLFRNSIEIQWKV